MAASYVPGPRHERGFGDDTMQREIGRPRASGAPEMLDLPIHYFRCPACGLLRDHTFTHADWRVWNKAEKDQRESAG